jgi:hypothetical protein
VGATRLDCILKQVVAGLGCDGMAVSAGLYKLLVMTGADSSSRIAIPSKADEMFVTLIVSLLRQSGRPPESSTDWRQDVKLSCSCADCRELLAFARDPVEHPHRFRVRQDRRRHLHAHHVDGVRERIEESGAHLWYFRRTAPT